MQESSDFYKEGSGTDYDHIRVDGASDKRSICLLRAAKALSQIETLDQWQIFRSEIYDLAYQIERIEKMRGKE
ncbi:MAG TPA: hypothetical protein VLB46_11860 [Pyrinomonadaceae bacterium]|nr:hypothetical protein [Pyrinomonadaceae bacterium]